MKTALLIILILAGAMAKGQQPYSTQIKWEANLPNDAKWNFHIDTTKERDTISSNGFYLVSMDTVLAFKDTIKCAVLISDKKKPNTVTWTFGYYVTNGWGGYWIDDKKKRFPVSVIVWQYREL